MKKIKMALGCDYVGFGLKEYIKKYLVEEKNVEIVIDSIKRPEDGSENSAQVTTEICEAIQRDECRLALLICGTGIGFCHMANTFWGIRACTVSDTYSAKRARLSTDAQVLCLGARVLAPEYAQDIVDAWLDEPFNWERESSVANKKQFEMIDNKRLKKPDFLAWNMGLSEDE